MTGRSTTSIYLRATIGLALCLFFGCQAGTKRGPEHISGTQFTLLSSDMNIVSVPDTIETVAIDSIGMYNGREFTFTAKPMSTGLVLIPLNTSQRVHEQENGVVSSIRGRVGVTTSSVPLRYYSQAPCTGALLTEPGTYTIRLKVTESSSIWEIDMEPWITENINSSDERMDTRTAGAATEGSVGRGANSYSTGDVSCRQ